MRWVDAGLAAGLVACVAVAAGLEGGVEHRMGGPPLVAAALIAVLLLWRNGLPRPGRIARVGIWFIALPMMVQLLPMPAAVRAVIAPGQAAWFDRVGEVPDNHEAWLEDLARRDVNAALGLVDPIPDLLAQARDPKTRRAALDPDALPWELGTLGAYGVVFVAAIHLGRRERVVTGMAIGLMLLGIVESVLGLLWRNGPTTGIGPKLYYLGSATGTFVNRGHYAAFLMLAIGATWGLAASLFPLVPEEVRRHRARKRRSSQPPSVVEVAGDKIPRLLLLGFIAGVLSLGLIASTSRGPIIGLVVAAAIGGAWTWWRRDERMHAGIGLGVPACGVILATLAMGPRGAIGRFANLGSDDVSYTSRMSMWKESVHALVDAPFFGAGLGGWATAWPLYEAGPHLYSSRNAHNDYLQWAVELGVPGLVGLVLLLVAWLGTIRRGLDLADQSLRTSVGVGLGVAVIGVLIQSFADFPLKTPGVALACALAAGLVVGCLSEATPEPDRRAAGIVGGLLAVGLLGAATWVDIRTPGTRAQRLGEEPELVYNREPRTIAEAQAWLDESLAAAARTPLDPWKHAAAAQAASLLAKAGESGQPEDLAMLAELESARARKLRPRDPRLLVYLSDAKVRLAQTMVTRDVFIAEATDLLAAAVHDDFWRAEKAFRAAEGLPLESLARIAAGAPEVPMGRARVLYEYGRALEKRGEKDLALDVHRQASEADPTFGPPAFSAAVILYKRGDHDAAEPWFDRFLNANERPGGMEGWALHFLGRQSEAESRLRKVVQDQPKNRWAWEGLAAVARATQDPKAELQALEKMRELGGSDKAINQRIEALQK